ncbi:HNH endonuclease signature motif containing protein [Flavobacterium sp.]|jgi:hypothetical protein|uniref:HNH endonuclease signature motif containing protein n=1 Tax=Flavobacterium sp. TaxID=239 RepID=UPI0037BE9024
MNYQKVYNSIIDAAQLRNAKKGDLLILESHHIVPKSCGGSNKKENLVNLTLKEHYICHLLLERMYRGSEHHIKMLRAAFMMGRSSTKTSRTYQSVKEAHIKNLQNQTISTEQKLAISQANKGNKGRTGYKNSLEKIELLRQSRLGSKHSEETKANLSAMRKGIDPWNKGKSGYTIDSYPKNRKSRGKHSPETIEKMRLARKKWHEDKGHIING